jgi:hypothetical protein
LTWLTQQARLDTNSWQSSLSTLDATAVVSVSRPGRGTASLAAPGEVLVSSTVRDLVAGSGFSFDDRGEHDLKGVPGTWRLYAVV